MTESLIPGKSIEYLSQHEIWAFIPTSKVYQVSSFGNIKSLEHMVEEHNSYGSYKKVVPGKKITRTISKWGYYYVKLNSKFIDKEFYQSKSNRLSINVSRLIALTFLPNPRHYTDTHHKDYNKLNNNVGNLLWYSHKENMDDMFKHYKNNKKVEENTQPKFYICKHCHKKVTKLYGTTDYCPDCYFLPNVLRNMNGEIIFLDKNKMTKRLREIPDNEFAILAHEYHTTASTLHKIIKKCGWPRRIKDYKPNKKYNNGKEIHNRYCQYCHKKIPFNRKNTTGVCQECANLKEALQYFEVIDGKRCKKVIFPDLNKIKKELNKNKLNDVAKEYHASSKNFRRFCKRNNLI